jgi:murein DD-endopeptidase
LVLDASGKVKVRVLRPVSKRWLVTADFGEVNPNLRDGLPHKGVDFGCPIGTPVLAAFDGFVGLMRRVEEGTEKERRAGNRLALYSHDGKFRALYFHLSRFECCLGDKVQAGDVIALSGDTGVVTGAHLHFETRRLPEDEAFQVVFDEPIQSMDVPGNQANV